MVFSTKYWQHLLQFVSMKKVNCIHSIHVESFSTTFDFSFVNVLVLIAVCPFAKCFLVKYIECQRTCKKRQAKTQHLSTQLELQHNTSTISVSLTTKVPALGSRESVSSVGRKDKFLIDGSATGDFSVAVGLAVGGLWFNEMQKASLENALLWQMFHES